MTHQLFETREQILFENEGQKLYGVLHRPFFPAKSSEKVPAVLFCHGFAGNKIGKHRIYISLAQRLAQLGIASLRFDFRGSGESEGEFSEMTLESEVSDALQALKFLRQQNQIDRDRIGLLGNSFGGAVAVLAAQQDCDVKSLALVASLFNSRPWVKAWQAFQKEPNAKVAQQQMSQILDGNVPGPAFYETFLKLDLQKAFSELAHIPLILAYGEQDERVGRDQVEQFKHFRQGSSAQTRWLPLHKSGHDFSNPDERYFLVQEVADWLARTL